MPETPNTHSISQEVKAIREWIRVGPQGVEDGDRKRAALAALDELEEQFEAAINLLHDVHEANPNGYYGQEHVEGFIAGDTTPDRRRDYWRPIHQSALRERDMWEGIATKVQEQYVVARAALDEASIRLSELTQPPFIPGYTNLVAEVRDDVRAALAKLDMNPGSDPERCSGDSHARMGLQPEVNGPGGSPTSLPGRGSTPAKRPM